MIKQYSNEEIGRELKLSKRTVEWYRSKMMEKTKTTTPIGLVVFGIREQIIDLDFKD